MDETKPKVCDTEQKAVSSTDYYLCNTMIYYYFINF